VAALQGLTLAHGGTAGLIVEAASIVALSALLLWAAIRSRRDREEGDP
jgi:hypothetical protein